MMLCVHCMRCSVFTVRDALDLCSLYAMLCSLYIRNALCSLYIHDALCSLYAMLCVHCIHIMLYVHCTRCSVFTVYT